MISSGHTDSNLRADRPCFNQAVWDRGGYHANDDRDANGTRLQRMNNSNSPQPNMEAGEAHTMESRGRGRGSNARQRRKRPEVQIYVPRAKRLQQQGGNNPTQNVETSTNDNNSHHCTHPHNRSSSLVTSRVGGELNIERRSLSPQSIGRGRAKPKDFHDDKHRQSLKKIRKDNSVSEKKSIDKNAPTFQNSHALHDLQTVNVSETEVRFPGNKDHHSIDIKCETLDISEGQNDSVSLMGGSSNTLILGNQIVPQNSSSGQSSSPESIQDVGVNSMDRFYDALEEKGVISKCVGARNADVLKVEEEKESFDLHSNLSSDNELTKSTNLLDTERQTTSGLKTEVCLVENVRIETSSSFNENTGSSLHSEQHQFASEASGSLSIEAERVALALWDNDDAPLLSEREKTSFTMSDEKDMSNNQDGVSLLSSCDSYNDQQDSAKELPESDYQSDSTALENQNSPSTGETADNAMHLDDLQRDKINVQCSDKQTVDTPLQSGELERLSTRVEDSTAEHLSDFDKQSTQIMSEPAAFSDSFSDKIVKPSEDMQNTSKEEKLSEDCGNLISSEMASNANEAEVEISKTIGEVGTENADVLQVKDEQDVETDIPMEKAAKTEILYKPLMGKSGEHSVCEEGAAMDTDDEESWDKLFTEDGDCLDPKVMEELTAAVGSVKVEKPQAQNYYKYQPKSADLDFEAYDHVLEISEFPAAFLTRDLISAFQAFMSRGFDIKWVDDTHALGIFSSAIAANEALSMQHPLLKVKPLSEADRQSKVKAKRSVEFLQPYKPRPETSASAARRLVTGALGLAPRVSREKREQERQQMREAKARRKQDKKNKEDAWEGNYGKCAMDEDS